MDDATTSVDKRNADLLNAAAAASRSPAQLPSSSVAAAPSSVVSASDRTDDPLPSSSLRLHPLSQQPLYPSPAPLTSSPTPEPEAFPLPPSSRVLPPSTTAPPLPDVVATAGPQEGQLQRDQGTTAGHQRQLSQPTSPVRNFSRRQPIVNTAVGAPSQSQPPQNLQTAFGARTAAPAGPSASAAGPSYSSTAAPPANTRTTKNPFSLSGSAPSRRFPAARLWNPTNSTPRVVPTNTSQGSYQQQHRTRERRKSTPPPPSIPLSHPALEAGSSSGAAQGSKAGGGSGGKERRDSAGTAGGDYPLLSLPEQHQSKHNSGDNTSRASLQVERRSGTGDANQRVSLPRSVRHSYDDKTSAVNKGKQPAALRDDEENAGDRQPVVGAGGSSRVGPSGSTAPTGDRRPGQSLLSRTAGTAGGAFGLVTTSPATSPRKPEKSKGKGKEPMTSVEASQQAAGDGRPSFSRDLERGPDVLGHQHSRRSTSSIPSGILGAALGDPELSSDNSSILGDAEDAHGPGGDGAGGPNEEWGPQHPCYPHLNPHVPIDSPLYASTRIIRVRRDWMLEGDLAPTFSNLYPEILDPAGLPEHEFRRIIEKLNSELVPAFNPFSPRNWLDNVLGLLTGWLWDDLGLTGVKTRLRRLEKWIEDWNNEMERRVLGDDAQQHRDPDADVPIPPRIVPLRNTGYMTVSRPMTLPRYHVKSWSC